MYFSVDLNPPFYWYLIFFALSVPFKLQRVEDDNYDRKMESFATGIHLAAAVCASLKQLSPPTTSMRI